MASAWESDVRLTYGCMICGAPGERAIDVPELPDVRVWWRISALCSTCEIMAMGGDRAGLGGRWQPGSHGTMADLDPAVRSVLAWGGHVYEAEPTPSEYRDPDPQPLTGVDVERWAALGPKVRGRDAAQIRLIGRVEGGSILGPGRRVVRNGYRVRRELDDGTPTHLTDGVTSWRVRDGVASAEPFRSPDRNGPRLHELDHRSDHHASLFGFSRPLGPIEPVQYLDRSAWRLRFAAPPDKPFDMRVIVDDLTGLVLEQRFGPDHLMRWTEFRTEVDPDPALFTWTGPVRNLQDDVNDDAAQWAARVAARQEWFASHVAGAIVVPAGKVEVEVNLHHQDGSFTANLSGVVEGTLSRRVRSDAWWELGWREVQHRWSDDRFDWALSGDFDPIDRTTADAIRAALA